jgi:hypothetical protein
MQGPIIEGGIRAKCSSLGHCPTTLAPSECVVIQASGLLADLPLDTGTCIVSSLGTLLHMCDSLGL